MVYMKQRQRCRVGGVIVDGDDSGGGRVLLLYRFNPGRSGGDREYYVLPGGGVEEGETVLEAVEREVEEETSLDVVVERELYRLIDRRPGAGNAEEMFYLCRYISGTPTIGDGTPEAEKIKNEGHQYRLEWHLLDSVANVKLYPDEIKTLIVRDAQTGFTHAVDTVVRESDY